MIQRTVLDNGVVVITAPFAHFQSVSFGFWFYSGTRHEEESQKGLAHFLEHMAFKGTAQKTSLEIARDFERLGAQVNAYTSREITAYHARVLNTHFHKVFDELAHIVNHSVFPKDEMVKEKNVVLQELADAEDTPDDIIFDLCQELAFPDQSLGWSILGTSPCLEKLTQQDLQHYTQKNYTGQNLVVAAAGPILHDDVVALAQKAFGHLNKGVRNSAPKGLYKGGAQYIKRDLQQQHTILGYEGLAMKDERFYALSVLSALLGGGMSSKLFEEIREKHGLAYSVYTFSSSFEDTGFFGMYLGTKPEDGQKAIDLTKAILKNFDPYEDEIVRAKNQIKTALIMGSESPFATIELAAQQMIYMNESLVFDDILKAIDGVDKKALVTLAQDLFQGKETLISMGNL